MNMPNSVGRWAHRYRTAPSLMSKVLTLTELLMPPAMLGLGLYATSFLVAAAIGFQPYQITGYEAIPRLGCVGDPLRIYLKGTLDPVPLGQTDTIDVWGYWISDKNEVTPKEPFATKIGPRGEHIVRSELVRTMPIVPGEWRMIWEVRVIGSVLGVEADQSITYPSKGLLTVVERTPANLHLCENP